MKVKKHGKHMGEIYLYLGRQKFIQANGKTGRIHQDHDVGETQLGRDDGVRDDFGRVVEFPQRMSPSLLLSQ